ncbi:hypothetical protein [Shouchella shacheensis]|nr:hypothetical protein [Shouchella shacheensis]
MDQRKNRSDDNQLKNHDVPDSKEGEPRPDQPTHSEKLRYEHADEIYP